MKSARSRWVPVSALTPSAAAGTNHGTGRGERICRHCGDPKPLAEFRVVGPLGHRHRLNTCKGCQRRVGLGAACQPPRL